jgi:hypothetical protein
VLLVEGILRKWHPELGVKFDVQKLHTVLFSVYTNAWGYKEGYKKGRREVGFAIARTLKACGVECAGKTSDIADLVSWFYVTKGGMSKVEAVVYETRHWVRLLFAWIACLSHLFLCPL